MAQESVFPEVEELIKQRIQAKETEIQTVLREARDRYITELKANITYHERMAETMVGIGNHQTALRHDILADIYKSLLERA